MSAPVDTAMSPPAPEPSAAGGRLAAVESLSQRWGDRLNPLVVKDLRQGLRTRVFWVCFSLLLLACLMVALVAYVETRGQGYAHHGRGYFFSFFLCLGFIHFFVIPYSAYRSLAREREDETWVLVVLTGLGSRRILRGKVASFLVQAALYASAVGPFLLFSYFLNGIALSTILVVLALGGAWLVFLTVAGVCAATLADGRMGRAFVHFGVLGALGLALAQGLGGAYAMTESGERLLRDTEFTYGVLFALMLMLLDGWLLFEAAASRLALPTEDYSRGPRRALGVQVLLAMAAGTAIWWLGGRAHLVAELFGLLGGAHLVFVGMFVVADVDGQARALRAATRPWSVLRPGALRGFRWMVFLLAAWGALFWGLQWASSDLPLKGRSLQMATVVLPAYGVLFLSLAVGLSRRLRPDQMATPVAVRLLFVASVALASALPPLLAVLLGHDVDDGLINLLNPLVGVANFASYDYGAGGPKMSWDLLGFVVAVALLAAYATDRMLVERERRAHDS
ncbi:ABC transporter permease [Corallococcus macrosporus DSM 14697]|uniref:ABC transporter permease n=2 Tax=Corallococcus macrosporus TaxID=35 RepID=A0A250K3D2_9BACT|nr:ABC transporter permease [Corallococcus macrosporus DSM 14697]